MDSWVLGKEVNCGDQYAWNADWMAMVGKLEVKKLT
jgi:hypothetical protein